MTDVTKMSDEDLKARSEWWASNDPSSEPALLFRELASRLNAALEREREDVEAMGIARKYLGYRTGNHWDEALGALNERLAAREKP